VTALNGGIYCRGGNRKWETMQGRFVLVLAYGRMF
jgi:hypothetical protein